MSAANGRKRSHRESDETDGEDSDSRQLYPCQEKPLKLVKREVPSPSPELSFSTDEDDDEEEVDEEDDADEEDLLEEEDEVNELQELAMSAMVASGASCVPAAIALAFPALAAKVKVTPLLLLLLLLFVPSARS